LGCGVPPDRAYRSPVPPPPAVIARAFATDPARWAYHFARQLTASTNGPLYPGRWRLAAPQHPGRWESLVLDGDPVGRIGWELPTPWWQVLALRPLAGAEAAT
jgi:hypothetical protein